MFKQRRIAKRLLARAEADPAIRADWMQAHKMLFIGFQVAGVGPNAHDPDHWRDSFKDCLGFHDKDSGDSSPTRQELEWWRAMCEHRRSIKMCPGGWLPALNAMIAACDSMLPAALVGPSSERYP